MMLEYTIIPDKHFEGGKLVQGHVYHILVATTYADGFPPTILPEDNWGNRSNFLSFPQPSSDPKVRC
jgi:hypothetical protein